jgi:hypothetical protein
MGFTIDAAASGIQHIVTLATSIIFFAVLATFIVLSFILDYHLRMYSTSLMRLYSIRVAYVVVSGILIFIMIGALPFIFN